MPVISPRRSTSSTSGSLYIPQTTSGTYSSSLTNKSSAGSSALSSTATSSLSSSTSGYSSTYRSNGYTKTPSTSYSNSSFYPGSYLSRGSYSSLNRSSYSSTPTSALTGGSSALSSSYRASSYLSGGNNDTTTSSSRFGRDLERKKRGTDNTDCNQNNSKNNNNNIERSSSTNRNSTRASSSLSSPSLARLVATSALEIYEKYSPSNYIPKCELSRSSSLSEGAASSATTAAATTTSSSLSSSSSSNSSTARNNDNKITHSNSISRITNNNSNSNNINGNYTRRYGRQINGTINENNEDAPAPASSIIVTDTYVSVPQLQHSQSLLSHSSSNGGIGSGSASAANNNKLLLHVSYDLPDDSNSLKDLKISCISPTTTTINTTSNTSATTTSTTTSSSSQDTKDTAQLANKVRSTSSLRTTLPPLPPNPSRDWDRDRSSILSSRNLSDDYSSSTSSSKKLSPEQEGLCGLRNIGNTCFMNSVIQCLSHTSELTKFLKTQNGVRSSSSKDQQILSEFAKLIREMWSANTSSVTPSELKRAFSSKHRMYSDYNQQDAQEFLRFFLDSLHSALNTGVKGEPLKIDENLSDNRKADITWEWYTRQENSVIRDLFVGQLKSTLRCTVCGNTSVTFDPVWDLSVPLPSSSRCKLEACLDLFIREEVLDGDEMPTCSKCQTRRKSTKSFTIQRFPKYLVIHLKRFSETRWSKMSNIVEFPTGERELNMGPYGSNSSSNVYYSLYAISNHMGSTAGGHYVALCKHPITRKWHEFNDNVVSSELSELHLVSSSAYILFFERAN